MKVKDLLTGPDKWTQGWNARDIDGFSKHHDGVRAVCWCLHGAIWKCYGPLDGRRVCDKVEHRLHVPLTHWNDSPNRTFDEVRRLVEELDI